MHPWFRKGLPKQYTQNSLWKIIQPTENRHWTTDQDARAVCIEGGAQGYSLFQAY